MEKNQKLKTKVRFTSLDVAAMVQNLQALIGMRATNIYDLNPSTYLIKLAKSEDKSYLLIQNGVRFHTTEQRPDKKAIPSGFTMKFRKYLRSKRLEAIRQVGVQRVVVFTFGSQSFVNHLIIQLYSQGNIILTDNHYRILQCIRSHQFNEKVKTAVGQIYPFEYAANIYLENLEINPEKIQAIFQKDEKIDQAPNNDKAQQNKKTKKGGKKGPVKLRDLIQKLLPCLFPLVIDHILISNNKNPDEKVSKQNKELSIECGQICLNFLKSYLKSKHKGYLFYKETNETKEKGKQVDYFEFSSYKNSKYSTQLSKQLPTFDQAVSLYFQNYKKNQHEEEENIEGIAWKKYDQIKKDQDERVRKLQQEQDIYKLKAEYIEKNIADVDAIIKIIKTMEDNGYSWDDIARMVSESKKNGDPLANMIHELTILKRQVTILLGDPVSQQQMFELLPVQINIDYNAYTNATMYYESKKKNYQKQQRTKEASQQVLKLAEKEALKKIQKKKNEVFSKNLPQRKVFWFEKFAWFISSEGYLVIAGKDSHQNELLVKRYMKSGDLYMHSDYGGAASTVIKSHRKDITVPLNTLEEAAIFTVCRSKAWQTKIISGAWWVYPEQVSKSAPTGEFLPTGSFMIRGKRNFIYPNRMQMGMTLLYKVDNDSAQRHFNDRRIHQQENKKEAQQLPKLHTHTEQKQQQQFAIVSIDMQTRKEKIQQKNKQKQTLKKQTSIKVEQPKNTPVEKDSDASDDESDEQQNPVKLTKKPSQTNKNQKPTKKQQQNIVTQQKHKQRNKKKLKKLEKYLEEQDEDERQIIMKMIGAKQMKHMKDPSEIEQEKAKLAQGKGKKKKDKNDVKKGINKYIDFEDDDEDKKEKLNPDKVLFLKDKKQQQQDEKKLMENSQSSEDEKQKECLQNSQTKPTQNQQILSEKIQQSNAENQKENDANQENEQDEKDQEDNEEEMEQKPTQENKEEPEELVDQKILDSELGELYKLAGNLHQQDKPEFFVPMCAPYNAIKENRFKIKLVPGGLKKGKAARNIIQYFQSFDLSQKQKPMLRALPEQDLINAVIGNVKLAGAGLLKMEMKEKQDKKMKRKEQDKKKDTKEITE